MSNNYQRTFSGRYVDVFNLTPDMICIGDIAHSLSFQARFNGHCKKSVNIGWHSIRVAHLVSEAYRLEGLLHDASETYLGDLVSPVKNDPTISAIYRPLEKKVQDFIYGTFNVYPTEESHAIIKIADNKAYEWEAERYLRNEGYGVTPPSSEETEEDFLAMFNFYKK